MYELSKIVDSGGNELILLCDDIDGRCNSVYDFPWVDFEIVDEVLV